MFLLKSQLTATAATTARTLKKRAATFATALTWARSEPTLKYVSQTIIYRNNIFPQGPLHHGAGQDLVPAALCLRQGGVRHLAAGGRLRRGTGWGFFLKKMWEIIKKFLFFFSAGYLYCEDCYGKYLAPDCEKCRKKITGVSKETFL